MPHVLPLDVLLISTRVPSILSVTEPMPSISTAFQAIVVSLADDVALADTFRIAGGVAVTVNDGVPVNSQVCVLAGCAVMAGEALTTTANCPGELVPQTFCPVTEIFPF